ncbi:hypothetical protein AUQ43_03340 [Thalassospira sp. MCCC 1A01148]|uniref:Uncharacterized protein n=1 Tax=Thalassospira profundimaris TaxID=502049 RepID=A0A367V8M2_9PROT|nr:hypothetical protein AUQ43_03340 [Thalassospira sp. MCCC 1A01148]RCK21369.1 hypothetical protein TH6_12165 [Thalassospira profundimaris]
MPCLDQRRFNQQPNAAGESFVFKLFAFSLAIKIASICKIQHILTNWVAYFGHLSRIGFVRFFLFTKQFLLTSSLHDSQISGVRNYWLFMMNFLRTRTATFW